MPVTPGGIVEFWANEVGKSRWFANDPTLDALIVQRYRATWDAAKHGDLSAWQSDAEGALALVLVLDQFPRNMFRGHADSFSTDTLARAAARRALDDGFDLATHEDLRAFFYMPFMHSEDMADQDKSVALFAERLGKGSYNYPYALEHRAEIARFGRFPSRNAALGRLSTDAERDFLAHRPQ